MYLLLPQYETNAFWVNCSYLYSYRETLKLCNHLSQVFCWLTNLINSRKSKRASCHKAWKKILFCLPWFPVRSKKWLQISWQYVSLYAARRSRKQIERFFNLCHFLRAYRYFSSVSHIHSSQYCFKLLFHVFLPLSCAIWSVCLCDIA